MLGKIRKVLLFFVGLTIPAEGLAINQIPGFPIGVNKLVTVILLLFAIFQYFSIGGRIPRNRKNYWIFAYAFTTAFSAAYAVVMGAPPSFILGPFVTTMALLLFYLLALFTIRDHGDLRSFLLGMVIGGGLVSITSLLRIGGQVVESAEGARAGGIGANVNDLARVLVVILIIAFGYQSFFRSKALRIAMVTAGFLCLLAVLHSLSREAWVGLAAVGGFVTFRFIHTKFIKHVVIGLVLILGILPFVVTQDMVDRAGTMKGGVHSTHGTIQNRVQQYRFAIVEFAKSPVIGVGLLRIGMYKLGGGVLRRNQDAHQIHNTLLQVLTAQGLLGFIPYIMLWILSWKDCSRAWKLQRVARLAKDRLLAEYAGSSAIIQFTLLGCFVAEQFSPAARTKIPYVLFALSTIFLDMSRKRVARIEIGLDQKDSPVYVFSDRRKKVVA